MSNILFDFDNSGGGQQHQQPVQKKIKAVLTKEQAQFNRLTKRIQQLRETLEYNTEYLNYLNGLYQEIVVPVVNQEGRYMKSMALKLDEKLPVARLGKNMCEEVEGLIMRLTADAMDILGPDPELGGLSKKYMQPDEAGSALLDGVMNTFLDHLHKETGLRVNPEHLKNGQIDYEKLEADLKAQVQEQEAKMKGRKKTAAQLKKEQAEQQKEELKQKSLRSVYVSLAKILHPDTEQDAQLRAEKEECMKQVTAAYEARNLLQLLQVEMTWMQRHEQSLQNTGAATLKGYIDLMKDQVKDLEMENDQLLYGPRYQHLTDYMDLSRTDAKEEMENESRGYNRNALLYIELIKQLDAASKPRKAIEKCLEALTYDDDDDMLDFDMMMDMTVASFLGNGKKRRDRTGR